MTSPTSSTPRPIPSAARFADSDVGGTEEQAREPVADDAVDLLGHAHVERAQTGLDVRERQAQLGGDERAGKRRVRVAVDEHGVRADVERGALDADEHRRGLLGVRRRADAELHVRVAQPELLSEHARERVIVVLSRVGDDELDLLHELGVQRGRLDELRPGAGDGEQAHRREAR